MKFTRWFALVAFLVTAMPRQASASGPAGSLQALFSDDDCEAVPAILGDWTA